MKYSFKTRKKYQLGRPTLGPYKKTTEGDCYSIFLNIPGVDDVYIYPRHGYSLQEMQNEIESIQTEFSRPIVSVEKCHFGWYKYVVDRTYKPYNKLNISLKNKIKLAQNGIIPIGKASNGKIISIQIYTAAAISIGGSSGGGKSKLLQNIIHSINDYIPTKDLYIYDPSGLYQNKQYPNVNIIEGDDNKTEQIRKHFEYLIDEMYKREKALKINNSESFLKLGLKPIITFIDESRRIFDIDRASTKKDATQTEKDISKIQEITNKLLSSARKTGIIIIFGFTDPIQSGLGIRLSDISTRIAVRLSSNAISESYLQDNSATDVNLVNGRFFIKNGFIDDKIYNGKGRTWINNCR